jgi:hypothetical protein
MMMIQWKRSLEWRLVQWMGREEEKDRRRRRRRGKEEK